MLEVNFDAATDAGKAVELDLYDEQAAKLRDEGIDLDQMDVPAVAKLPKAVKLALAPEGGATGGDSPNPYYDVFRSYSEPGGIADELRARRPRNRDVAKLVQIGTSLLGKPILRSRSPTTRATRPTARAPRCCTAPSTTRASGSPPRSARREAKWFLEHKNDPRIAEILKTTEIWVLPVFNPDGYDYTFTCGTGAAVTLCGPGEANSNRLWRKTLRDNNNDGIYGNTGDGVDPNRNFPEQWALDNEGSSPNAVDRGLPRPVRELRARERRL